MCKVFLEVAKDSVIRLREAMRIYGVSSICRSDQRQFYPFELGEMMMARLV